MRRASRGGGSHSRRRPVPVKVTRVVPARPTQRPPRPDVNNNDERVWKKPEDPPEPETTFSFLNKLPPVSSGLALFQVFLYLFREYFQIYKEEDICASSDNVMKQGQYWRLLVAQFFHFMKIPIYFNIMTLMTLGAKLEKKIKSLPYFLLTFAMSVLSNLFYVALSDIVCSSNSENEFTMGFSTTLFSLRMVHILTMKRDSSEGKDDDPCLVFGFIPVHLPASIVNWHPLMETILFDLGILGRCLASTVSGMLAALIFPILMKHFRHHIMRPLPAPRPPNVRPRPRPDPDASVDRNANISNNIINS